MIHSFLKQSKPASFFFICVLMVAWVLVSADYSKFFFDLMGDFSLKIILLLAILFLLNFIIQKNKLTQSNHYALYFFVLFWGLTSCQNLSIKSLWAMLFLVLGLRRILGLRTQTELRQKVFDASFWFSIGLLFEPIFMPFFILIFIGLLLYLGKPSRLWFVPLFGLFAVFFPVFTWFFWHNEINNFVEIFHLPKSFLYRTAPPLRTVETLVFILLTGSLSIIFFYKKMVQKSSVTRKSRALIFYAWLLSCILCILYYPVYQAILPLSLVFLTIPCTALVEVLPNRLLKEIWLYTCFLAVVFLVFWSDAFF